MAERWQQWMPFHIDRFRGSPDVQAMHPVARIGYLYLLASAWQTIDCTISSDPLDLASESGLGDDLWAQYSVRILRKFEAHQIGGRLYNLVLRDEWDDAKRIFQARSEAAKHTTKIRSPRQKNTVTVGNAHGQRTVTERSPVRSADTITGTYTETIQEQKTSRAKAASDPRHMPFRDALSVYWVYRNPGSTEMPWDGRDAKALSNLLAASPGLTLARFQDLLRNRGKSAVAHGDRIYVWISKAHSYTEPLNEFNRPGGVTNGKHSGLESPAIERQRRNLNALKQAMDDSGDYALGRDDGPHRRLLPEPGAK